MTTDTAPTLTGSRATDHPPMAAGLVHAPLARWARERPRQPAIIQDAHGPHEQRLDFAGLHAAMRAWCPPEAAMAGQRITHATAADTVLLTQAADPLTLLTAFLGVIHSGRCAAVADPDWPPALLARMAAALHIKDTFPLGHGQDKQGWLETPFPDDEASLSPAFGPPSPDTPFYIGFTSGSTGLPKGFRRDHRSWVETFRVTLQDFGPAAQGRVLAPGRMSHSLFLFGALLGLWTGGGTSVQRRFSATRTLASLADGSCPVMVGVPSQLMLLLAAADHRRHPPIPQLKLLLVSGARWAHEHTPALQQLFPQARIITFYGASETSYISWMESSADTPADAVGRPFSNVQIHIGPTPSLPASTLPTSTLPTSTLPASTQPASTQPTPTSPAPTLPNPTPSDSTPPARNLRAPSLPDPALPAPTPSTPALPTPTGLIWVRSPMLFSGYVNDQDGTAALRVGDWLSVRDVGWLDAEGMLHLTGRENRMIVTQARNLFPEEVEARLQAHPDIRQAAVLGLPDPQRGQVVHAIVQGEATLRAPHASPVLHASSPVLQPPALAAWCRETLEPWKVPRHWWIWPGTWPMTASGKTDHAQLQAWLLQQTQERHPSVCRSPHDEPEHPMSSLTR